MTRGNNVFSKVQTITAPTPDIPVTVRDMFLHSLFGRLALTDGRNVELETRFNKDTQTVELIVPPFAMDAFDQITGMQRGPNLRAFIDWLIGTSTLIVDTSGGLTDQKFLGAQLFKIWRCAQPVNFNGVQLVLQFPAKEESVIGHNLRIPDNVVSQRLLFTMPWMFLGGDNSGFTIRMSANITRGGLQYLTVTNSVNISTAGKVFGDVTETLILDTGAVLTGGDFVGLLIERCYAGSPDPDVDAIGFTGLRINNEH